MQSNQAARRRAAAILNAAYLVRHYRRPCARELRALAIAALAAVLIEALNNSGEGDTEALLYALAIGLHDAGDARFTV